jgi:2,3-bisphosphoglycerate-dependent phosphoglycerate mutase
VREVEVHLVRHGQSTWNVEGRLQGQTAHPPLTSKGRADAARAAAQLAAAVGRQAVAIVSSDLIRASQTAEIIESALGTSGAAIVGQVCFTEALREQHLGSMQGRLTAELRPEPVPEGRHIGEVRWGGGESLADVHERLDRYFRSTLPGAPRHLIAVTHGDTLRVARAALNDGTHRDVEWDVVANGAVISVVCSVDRPAHAGNSDRRPRGAGLPTGAGNG